ncbi:MAG: RNA-binding S4 domain-containing protein [Bacteroidia bacterium]|nr:RNA-binding S4 domain-containing protein [Bacteroidia bacterium]MCZ2277109.1 RNA-binding S4 domain-containing protein [Bacteroidia bacterium]
MIEKEKLRIDKWLWAVRLCKTRSVATVLCNEGKVIVNGQQAKPSKIIHDGDRIVIRRGAFSFEYQILRVVHNRLPARDVKDYCADVTPEAIIEQFKTHLISQKTYKDWRTGRPTKKDRRDLEDFFEW